MSTHPKLTYVVTLLINSQLRGVFYSREEAEGFLLENKILHLPYEIVETKLLHSDLSDPVTLELGQPEDIE